MKKKKIFMLLAAISAILALTIGGTLAFLQSTAQAENIMTIGNVDIEVDEEWDPGDADDLVPGESRVKAPSVRNTGRNEAFVRMYLTGNWIDYVYFNHDNITTSTSEWGPNRPWLQIGELGAPGTYFYYYRALAGSPTGTAIEAQDATAPLFNRVTIREDLTEETQITGPAPFDDGRIWLVVNAEAIQAAGLYDDGGNLPANAIEAFDFWNRNR